LDPAGRSRLIRSRAPVRLEGMVLPQRELEVPEDHRHPGGPTMGSSRAESRPQAVPGVAVWPTCWASRPTG
ncbi:MAG: hypothetical protein ACYCYK_07475, partial [Candidatus Dormibacteria bacterium]